MQNRKTFLDAVQTLDGTLETVHCALLFSQAINPGLDVQHHADVLHSLIDEAANTGIDSADSLLAFIHGKHKFRGNSDEYYSIENSLLDRVLEKRVGIPISLALVYLAIGNSCGLTVYGINFPGHFLVGVGTKPFSITAQQEDTSQPIEPTAALIDPFAANVVSREQCFKLLDHLYQGRVDADDRYFEPAGNDIILIRLIENIKAIYLQQNKAEKAMICLDYQLLISPGNISLLSQQNQLLEHVKKQGGNSSVLH